MSHIFICMISVECFRDEIFDDNDYEYDFLKAKFKGRLYCFAIAIRGLNPRERLPYSPYDLAGVVPDCLWYYEGGSKGRDYQAQFNKHNFLEWFTNRLLPNLTEPTL
jgi:hypothetical protein